MDDAFKIYVDQLRDGHIEQLNEEFSPEFMGIQEEDLRYLKPISVTGEAYLAESDLVLHLNIETQAVIPCTICNEPVDVDISIKGVYHTAPFEEIKSGLYFYRDILRESILLETPRFAECEGKCPQRKEIQKYLKEEGADKPPQDTGQQPFAHLE
jgi:uncharacterized metal-binding protein YceD (DUF177 family)